MAQQRRDAFDKGQGVRCRATPHDGFAPGAPVDSANEARVLNTPPSIGSVTLAPIQVALDGTLTCAWSGWHDPDPADAPDVRLQWRIDGDAVPGEAGPTLSGPFAPGASIVCRATPHNGAEAGPAMDSAPARAAIPCTTDAECDDGEACTSGGVRHAAGCQYVPASAPCDDGDACTVGDVCAGGSCAPGPLADCVDSAVCPADSCDPGHGCLVAQPPSSLAIEIGYPPSGGVFEPAEDGAPIEIVQGPQGGVHLEAGVRIEAPPWVSWSPAKAQVEVEIRTPCCTSGDPVGGGVQPVAVMVATDDGGYVSGKMAAVFYTPSASPFAQETCCVTVSVSLLPQSGAGPAVAKGTARRVFTCVDEQ